MFLIMCARLFIIQILHIQTKLVITRVEAESNITTVTLRVVGGDEKGSLESVTVKYGHDSYGTRTRK
jgi:hypothetical protein